MRIIRLPLLFIIVVISISAQTGPQVTTLQGQCEYGSRYAPLMRQGGNAFAICTSVTIVRSGAQSQIIFQDSNRDIRVSYEGALSGNKMTVRHFRVSSNPLEKAEGSCEIYWSNRSISTVACVARAGPTTHAANFVPRRW
ncbi:MAG: hypothetical protein AAGH53_10605 [Pseudomonadota bacterium]